MIQTYIFFNLYKERLNREKLEEEERAASQPEPQREPEPEPEPEQEDYGDVSYQPEPVHRQVPVPEKNYCYHSLYIFSAMSPPS